MVCRNENNLNEFKEFLNHNELKLKDHNSGFYKSGSFSVEDPDKNKICFGVLKDKNSTVLDGIHAPLQHLTFASEDVVSFQNFYENKLGFQVTDRVTKNNGDLMTCFTTSNHEHHTIACFKSSKKGMDHHSYEAGDWNLIKNWCDHFASYNIKLIKIRSHYNCKIFLIIFISFDSKDFSPSSCSLTDLILNFAFKLGIRITTTNTK